MYKLFIAIITISFGSLALTQEATYELACRAKAKEIAAETYKTCITENKSAQLEQIKKDYQQKLKALKEEYEKELQKLSGKNAVSTPAKKTESGKVEKAEQVKAVKTAKASPKKLAKKSIDEMTIELKPSAALNTPATDDSMMDLPEPIPVENIPSESSL